MILSQRDYVYKLPSVNIGSNGIAEVHLPSGNVLTDVGWRDEIRNAYCKFNFEQLHRFRKQVDYFDDIAKQIEKETL